VHVHCHRRQEGVHVRLREEQMNGSMGTSTGPMVVHAVCCWHSLISDNSSHTSDGSDTVADPGFETRVVLVENFYVQYNKIQRKSLENIAIN
jgi:hypothetical protein